MHSECVEIKHMFGLNLENLVSFHRLYTATVNALRTIRALFKLQALYIPLVSTVLMKRQSITRLHLHV